MGHFRRSKERDETDRLERLAAREEVERQQRERRESEKERKRIEREEAARVKQQEKERKQAERAQHGLALPWAPSDDERCPSVKYKEHQRNLGTERHVGSSWRCALVAGHSGHHEARPSAHQSPWENPLA